MMALRAVSIAIGLIGGIVAAMLQPTPIPGIVITGVCLLAVAVNSYLLLGERRWKEWPSLVIVMSAIACSAPLGYWRAMQELGPPNEAGLRHAFSQIEDGTQITVEGTICHEPEMRTSNNGDIRLCVDRLRVGETRPWQAVDSGDEVLVRAYLLPGSSSDARVIMGKLMRPQAYGYRIRFESKFRAVKNTLNPGEFDYAKFLQQNGLTTRLRCYAGNISILEETRGSLLVELALLAKHSFLATYKQTIRAPASRLVAAATLGTRRAVEKISYREKDIAETFRHAGVGHVLAVSGLHVSVVTILLYSIFRMAGMRARVFVPPLILFLVLFALLTGARPSSVRAVIMNAVVLLSLAYFRCSLRKATAVGLALSSFLILVFNPMVLFAPSFLLSYGAVLSLVLISPTLDRWLRFLRGFSLIFFACWFLLFLLICIVRFDFFLHVTNCIGFAALLWALVMLGGNLNGRYPAFWRIGFEKIPKTLGMFISAQLAIQAGMMVPLSAWFFGRFPVAGVLVNLLAIPAVGILVQLGMLAGLLGMVPVIGIYLALPLGAADTIVGELFFRLANAGATWFPFPATPRPTIAWMIAYFVGVALVLSTESWRVWAQGKLYRWWPKLTSHKKVMIAIHLLPVLLVLLPLAGLIPRSDRCERITCLAVGRNPIVTMVSTRKKALLINAGKKLTGERVLFEAIRHQGPTIVEHAILCGPQPGNGMEGITGLASRMKIRTCHIPLLVDDPATYLDAIGDHSLIAKAREGRKWATAYLDAYRELLTSAADKNISLEQLADDSLINWRSAAIRTLPQPDVLPTNIIVKAQTLLLDISVRGFTWLIVTDTAEEALDFALAGNDSPYDVLVLPDLSSRVTYQSMITRAVELSRPRVIVISGDRVPAGFDFPAWRSQFKDTEFLMTAMDGAIEATFDEDTSMKLRGYRSGRTVALSPRINRQEFRTPVVDSSERPL